MMLDRVTITGADDMTPIDRLIALQAEFPFVEWGVLISEYTLLSQKRFPSFAWIEECKEFGKSGHLHLSAHLCGRYVRSLVRGEDVLPTGLLDGFERVQLNFHNEKGARDYPAFTSILRDRYPRVQWIFQVDNARGMEHFSAAIDAGVNCAPLFDTSGGLGKLPSAWPDPPPYYHGYAGGLSPKNVAEQVRSIESRDSDQRYWIDVESWVRVDERFDVEDRPGGSLVRSFALACAPFVRGW